MEYDFKEILDIGLEIEFSNIKRDSPNFVENLITNNINFKSVHDASAETPEITFGNIPIQFDVNGLNNRFLSILRYKNLETIGGELNSQILNSQGFREHIYKVINFLRTMGESCSNDDKDTRGSIHVHVNVSKDIAFKHLIRLLEVGLATEGLFYKLGGMGYVNRGVKNSFIYQRPITLPPCVSIGNKTYPIFDYKDLLESKNKTDFYNKYGDTVFQIRNGNHYVTQRYVGLNFYSIPYRGSLEFRYSNKTLIPEWICAWIVLCQSFVNYALTKPKDNSFENEYRKLEDNRDYSDNELIFIFDKLGVPEDTQITLLDIWHESTMPCFDGENILSHLPNPTFYNRDTGYYPKPILGKAKQSKVIDIRNLTEEKNHILNNVKYSRIEEPKLDYLIDTTGVKNKIKSDTSYYYIFEDNNNANDFMFNPDDEVERNFAILGININDFDFDKSDKFVKERVLKGKTVLFRVIRLAFWYECKTKFADLSISFRASLNGKEVELVGLDKLHNYVSETIHIESNFFDEYQSFGYNFHDYIEDMYYNPNDYFPELEEDNDENNEDDENNEVEEVDNNDFNLRLEQLREAVRERQNMANNNGGN